MRLIDKSTEVIQCEEIRHSTKQITFFSKGATTQILQNNGTGKTKNLDYEQLHYMNI